MLFWAVRVYGFGGMFVRIIVLVVDDMELRFVRDELSIELSELDVLRSHPASNAAKASVMISFFIVLLLVCFFDRFLTVPSFRN
jgi:hypothetical protein